MTSPIEIVRVSCRCGITYEAPYRASFNLTLDDFDDAYIERMSTGRCPRCSHVVNLGALVVERESRFNF